MKKKNLKFIILLIGLSIILVSGCSRHRAITTKNEDKVQSDKKVIYTTFFPVYDLTSRIIGDKMDIKMIIKGAQEPHDFEIQASEMIKISEADLIIYNGVGMEGFIDDLKDVVKNDTKFLDLSQGLTLIDGDDEHDEHEHDEHEHSHDHEFNPHTWLSIKNALIELETIYNKVISIDSDNKDYYQNNLDKALLEFKELDEKFEAEFAKISDSNKYFVMSHAAFDYLANDYGLKQISVTGISPEDEPSAGKLKEIADFVKDYNISTIFFEGKATPKVAEVLAKETGTKVASLHTMESVSDEEAEMGYLKIMEMNLEELVKSFNE